MGYDDWSAVRKRYLSTVGVPTESQVEPFLGNVEQPRRCVHEQDSDSIGSSKGSGGIWLPISMIVQTTDPHLMEGGIEPYIGIGQYSDPDGLERSSYQVGIRTPIMVS